MDSLARMRQSLPALSDVISEANHLHDVLIQTAADDILEAAAPGLMRAAWELRSKDLDPGTDSMEMFGTLLALWTVLRHPEVLQVATQRLYDRLCELMPKEDREMIALLQSRR